MSAIGNLAKKLLELGMTAPEAGEFAVGTFMEIMNELKYGPAPAKSVGTPTVSYLYVIKTAATESPIKIGMSRYPYRRLATLQTANPFTLDFAAIYRLSIEDTVRAERGLHEELSVFALEGEWFDYPSSDVQEYISNFFLSEGIEVVP